MAARVAATTEENASRPFSATAATTKERSDNDDISLSSSDSSDSSDSPTAVNEDAPASEVPREIPTSSSTASTFAPEPTGFDLFLQRGPEKTSVSTPKVSSSPASTTIPAFGFGGFGQNSTTNSTTPAFGSGVAAPPPFISPFRSRLDEWLTSQPQSVNDSWDNLPIKDDAKYSFFAPHFQEWMAGQSSSVRQSWYNWNFLSDRPNENNDTRDAADLAHEEIVSGLLSAAASSQKPLSSSQRTSPPVQKSSSSGPFSTTSTSSRPAGGFGQASGSGLDWLNEPRQQPTPAATPETTPQTTPSRFGQESARNEGRSNSSPKARGTKSKDAEYTEVATKPRGTVESPSSRYGLFNHPIITQQISKNEKEANEDTESEATIEIERALPTPSNQSPINLHPIINQQARGTLQPRHRIQPSAHSPSIFGQFSNFWYHNPGSPRRLFFASDGHRRRSSFESMLRRSGNVGNFLTILLAILVASGISGLTGRLVGSATTDCVNICDPAVLGYVFPAQQTPVVGYQSVPVPPTCSGPETPRSRKDKFQEKVANGAVNHGIRGTMNGISCYIWSFWPFASKKTGTSSNTVTRPVATVSYTSVTATSAIVSSTGSPHQPSTWFAESSSTPFTFTPRHFEQVFLTHSNLTSSLVCLKHLQNLATKFQNTNRRNPTLSTAQHQDLKSKVTALKKQIKDLQNSITEYQKRILAASRTYLDRRNGGPNAPYLDMVTLRRLMELEKYLVEEYGREVLDALEGVRDGTAEIKRVAGRIEGVEIRALDRFIMDPWGVLVRKMLGRESAGLVEVLEGIERECLDELVEVVERNVWRLGRW